MHICLYNTAYIYIYIRQHQHHADAACKEASLRCRGMTAQAMHASSPWASRRRPEPLRASQTGPPYKTLLPRRPAKAHISQM